MINEKYRYLNPVLTDRINHLTEKIQRFTLPPPEFEKTPTNNKYKEILEEYEIKFLKKNGFNFIIRNVPRTAIESYSGKKVNVTYASLRDTFNQFGSVRNLEICRGNVYITFKTTKQAMGTHDLINNMQMGENIIKTQVI